MQRLTVTVLGYEVDLPTFLERNARLTAFSAMLAFLVHSPSFAADALTDLLAVTGLENALHSDWLLFAAAQLITSLLVFTWPLTVKGRVTAAVQAFGAEHISPVDFEVAMIRAMKALKWVMVGSPAFALIGLVASVVALLFFELVPAWTLAASAFCALSAYRQSKAALFAGYSYVWLLGMRAGRAGRNPFKANTAREVFECGRLCSEYKPEQMTHDLVSVVVPSVARV